MDMKLCKRCNTEKAIYEFATRYGKPQAYCKSCNRGYQKQHYHNNKQKYKDDLRDRRKQYRIQALLFLMEAAKGGCVECGENDFRVLEFDHIDQTKKEFGISMAVSQGYSIGRIKDEVKKCQVMCANCHRKKTVEQLGWYSCLDLPPIE